MIEINDQFTKAIDGIKGRKNLFITGKAGTGKSTLLQYYRDSVSDRVVVLAPTGVAALNVDGQTIHSFFGFPADVTVSKITFEDMGKKNIRVFRNLKTLIIDEASMVRADLLDCIDMYLRKAREDYYVPFGGVQMIFIGDLYQLPPVLTSYDQGAFLSIYDSPYFFSAKAFKEGFKLEIIELDKIYRQTDLAFIDLLNKVRTNRLGPADMALLNSRHGQGNGQLTLTSTRALAEAINAMRLRSLPGEPQQYEGEISGQFDRNAIPTALTLTIKPGAQVMMLNNDKDGRWVNGTMAKVVEADAKSVKVQINSSDVEIGPYRWEAHRIIAEGNELATRSIGSFTQLPIILAWGQTIHRSQGKTFEKFTVDTGSGAFAHGQVYVALSRGTTLDGITLKHKINPKDIHVDPAIEKFLERK